MEDATADAVIVHRMAQGDESALGSLYDRWSDSVHALVVRIRAQANPVERRKSCVGSCFWQAWQQAGRYMGDRGTPGAWLLAMARSRALDRVRSMRRRRDDVASDVSIFANQRSIGDPLADLNATERAERVVAALAELPHDQRIVLELAYFEGLSQTEIAERLDQPLGTIKTRARLALRKMRDRLDALREVDA
ncbi:MAG: sigma-70 family RNA polymerase sigma factor [Gemmatimonadaceae bacterium]|nr:sigma-70 family RNA polymerase sigma factor [Gemmatimonadaceae bacterium]